MAIVLAFSMMSATALRAFAVELTAGTIATQNAGASSANDVVYDTVYGVFGSDYGEYALMMKTVTYEAQYKTNPNYEFRATVTDVVKTDGTVTVHGNNAAANHQKYIPGSATDYQFSATGVGSTGLLRVTQKSSNKVGVKSVDGNQIVPCSYDNVSMLSNNDIVGFIFNGTVGRVEFMDQAGNSLGATDFEIGTGASNPYAYVNSNGDISEVTVVSDSNNWSSGRYSFYVKKKGSRYERDDGVTKVWSQRDGRSLISRNDGNIYFCQTGQDEINLGSAEGYSFGSIQDNYMYLYSNNNGYTYFTFDGKKLTEHNPNNSAAWLDVTYITQSNGTQYGLYYIADNSLVKNLEGDFFKSVGIKHFAAARPVEFENGAATCWAFDIYDSMGNLCKEGVVTTTSQNSSFYENTGYDQVFYTFRDGSSYSDIYFDANFNRLSNHPSPYIRNYTLADGTPIHAVSASDLEGVEYTYAYESGDPLILNGKTIAASSDVGGFSGWNCAKHGYSDVWWGYDSNGKWGAVDSSGKTIIPFKYDAIFDSGNTNVDYALGRENGTWKFIKVGGSNNGDTTDVGSLPGSQIGSGANKWLKDSIGWFYIGADGNLVTSKWVKDSKGWCYVGADGYMVYSKWVKDSKGWCYVGSNGYMVYNKWVKDSKGWCYVGSDGYMTTNKWVKDSKGWCYVGPDGYCVTNTWKKDSKGWCYLDSNGRMATNKWVKDSKGWCYVGSDGYMLASKWMKISNKWYYFDAKGHMVTGTQTIGGKTYKFDSNGVWIQ